MLVEASLDKLLVLHELQAHYADLQHELASQYVNDPVGWVRLIGEDVWSKQAEVQNHQR